jgi:Ca2+-binding EF-hand superfamily protein
MTYYYIGHKLLTKNEKENLSKVFKACDTIGDGRLEFEEIK